MIDFQIARSSTHKACVPVAINDGLLTIAGHTSLIQGLTNSMTQGVRVASRKIFLNSGVALDFIGHNVNHDIRSSNFEIRFSNLRIGFNDDRGRYCYPRLKLP